MRHIILLVVVTASLYACSGKSNIEPPAELVDFTPTAALTKVWSRRVGEAIDEKYIRLVPVIDGAVIYAADIAGKVTAINAETGRRLWRIKLKQTLSSAVGYGDGLVLVATTQGKVIALDRETGAQKWASPVTSEVLTPPAASSGVVVVQSNDGKVFALSAANGEQLWIQQQSEPSLSLRGTSPPVITRGAVFTGFANGRIAAFVLKDGRLLWEITVSHPRGRSEIERLVDVDVSPLLIGNTLFAASYQGNIAAIDTDSGRVLWTRDISTYTGMTADAVNIYISDEAGNVIALDQRSGANVWQQENLHARWPNAPALVGDYIVIGDFEGYVHVISKQDGNFAARYRFGGSPIQAPILARNMVLYVSTRKGDLAALRIQ